MFSTRPTCILVGLVLALPQVGCKDPKSAATPAPQPAAATPAPAAAAPPPVAAAIEPAAPPGVAAFGAGALAEGTSVTPLADGKAYLAAISLPGAHGPGALRAVVNGRSADVLTFRTGDCSGGTITEMETRPSGSAVFRFGQASYGDCDDEAEAKADIDSHVECVEVAYDAASAQVVVKRRSQAKTSVGDLPSWCRMQDDPEPTAAAGSAPAAPPAAPAEKQAICCDDDVDGPHWSDPMSCEMSTNNPRIVPDANCKGT